MQRIESAPEPQDTPCEISASSGSNLGRRSFDEGEGGQLVEKKGKKIEEARAEKTSKKKGKLLEARRQSKAY